MNVIQKKKKKEQGNQAKITVLVWACKKIPDKVTMPVSLGSTLRYLLQKSADSNARKRTFPRKYPAVWPTELHVDA